MATPDPVPSEEVLNPGVQALDRFNARDWSSAIELARRQIVAPKCSNELKAEMHHIEAACLYEMGELQAAEKSKSQCDVDRPV